MAWRDWGWPKWVILMGGGIMLLLLFVVIYALLRPEAFQPLIEEPGLPIGVLPDIPIGPPVVPPSVVEQVPPGSVQTQDLLQETDLVAAGDQVIVQEVTAFPVNFIQLAPNGRDLNVYDSDTARFYRVTDDGQLTLLSDRVFANVQEVAWAPNSTEAILEFPDGRNILYNFDTDEQTTLPQHWTEFDFSSDSQNIAFKSLPLDPNENWLAVASKTGGSARLIEHLGNNAGIVNVDWAPNNQVIGTFSEQSGTQNSNLFFLGFNGENFPLSKLHGSNFEGSWSPDGEKLVYSVFHEDYNFSPALWVTDGPGRSFGQNRRLIGLQTWTDKCTYSSETEMFCGVPYELPRGSGLIRKAAEREPDYIARVDLQSGNISVVALPDQDLQVGALQVSQDGSRLFIHDNFTGRVRRIDLAE